MTRLLVYIFLFGATLYLLSFWSRRARLGDAAKDSFKTSRGFRSKPNPREIWVQVYETDSMEEARVLQARLQEEEMECILYEQGKKDIHGNSLKAVGVAVPRTAVHHAQGIIARMPT